MTDRQVFGMLRGTGQPGPLDLSEDTVTIYKLITPPEPPIGTVVRTASSFSYCRTENGWESAHGTRISWFDLLESGELEDVTPLRTWELVIPPEPEVGVKLIDRMGDTWYRVDAGTNGWTCYNGPGRPDGDRGDTGESSWSAVLDYAPLTEVRN